MSQDTSTSPDVKYNKIMMLVHPGYILTTYIRQFNPDAELSQIDRFRLRKFFGVYGKALLDAKKDPKTIFLIVVPNAKYLESSKRSKRYDLIFSKFFNFAKGLLGDRLIVVDYSPLNDPLENIFPKKYLASLDQEIDLESFGEYGEMCVSRYREKYLRKHLIAEGKIIKSSQTNFKYCFNIPGLHQIVDDCLNVRLLEHARDRRKLRRKFPIEFKGPRLPV